MKAVVVSVDIIYGIKKGPYRPLQITKMKILNCLSHDYIM